MRLQKTVPQKDVEKTQHKNRQKRYDKFVQFLCMFVLFALLFVFSVPVLSRGTVYTMNNELSSPGEGYVKLLEKTHRDTIVSSHDPSHTTVWRSPDNVDPENFDDLVAQIVKVDTYSLLHGEKYQYTKTCEKSCISRLILPFTGSTGDKHITIAELNDKRAEKLIEGEKHLLLVTVKTDTKH